MHKEYASGRFLLGLENPGSIASMVQNIDLYNLPKDYYRSYVRNIMAVTPADIQRVAKKYLQPDRVAILAVGDASVIAESLAKFGPVKMYNTDMEPVSAAKTFEVDLTASELIDKYIDAMGGRDKLSSIESRITEADVSLDFGMATAEGILIETAKLPNKKHQHLTMSVNMGGQAQTLESQTWVDGEHVVSQQPMQPLRSLEGEELARSLEDEQFNEILRLDELGYTATVTEKKSMDDRVVYVLEMKKKYATEELFIDAETWLLHARVSMTDTPNGPVATTVRYSDYREVDGIMLPFTFKAEAPNATIETHVTNYRHNTDIDDKTFRKTAN